MPGHPRDPMPWADARRQAYDSAVQLPASLRPLDACAGAVLASPLLARNPLPPWDIAAMDGYAVAGAGPWRVTGQVLAGADPARPLAPGTAVGIATGAAVPPGTTAVLPVEHATVAGRLRQGQTVQGRVEPGRHIRRTGEECARGDQLLPSGVPVTAAVLGLAAASGHDELLVRPRPAVVALVTGDELLTEGAPREGRVRDALGPQLPRLVASAGGDLLRLDHLRDDDALLRKSVELADGDVVLVTGASSVGAADHLRAVLVDLEARLLVDGVACRPGHPQLLARLPDGRFVVGLPGNPLAALVAAGTVLVPLLAGLAGRAVPRVAALLAEPLPAGLSRTRLVPVRLEGLQARPVPHTGAGMLRGAALADALAVVPPGADLPVGAEVEVLPLP